MSHPEIVQNLRDEIRSGNSSNYVDQVWRETLRKYPAASLGTARSAIQDLQVGDVLIRKGVKK